MADPNYDDKNAVEFAMPDGFNPPSGSQPGDEFQAVGTFKLKDNGNMCLVDVEGYPVKPSTAPAEPDSDDMGMVDAIEKGLGSNPQ